METEKVSKIMMKKYKGFSLPMRDGNIIAAQRGAGASKGFSLPMRDGNYDGVFHTDGTNVVLAYL